MRYIVEKISLKRKKPTKHKGNTERKCNLVQKRDNSFYKSQRNTYIYIERKNKTCSFKTHAHAHTYTDNLSLSLSFFLSFVRSFFLSFSLSLFRSFVLFLVIELSPRPRTWLGTTSMTGTLATPDSTTTMPSSHASSWSCTCANFSPLTRESFRRA